MTETNSHWSWLLELFGLTEPDGAEAGSEYMPNG